MHLFVGHSFRSLRSWCQTGILYLVYSILALLFQRDRSLETTLAALQGAGAALGFVALVLTLMLGKNATFTAVWHGPNAAANREQADNGTLEEEQNEEG